jgi:MOSC domain-containing protein YiiM
MDGRVVSVSANPEYGFSKPQLEEITLVEGHGVEGDAHAGATVRHRFLVRKDPTAPNLRQVHLMHKELFDHVATLGHTVLPGELGENITTEGIDLLALPRGTRLRFGEVAEVELTLLRNPCGQIEDFQEGLKAHLQPIGEDGVRRRLSGVMSIVTEGGRVRPGDRITITLPREPYEPLTT